MKPIVILSAIGVTAVLSGCIGNSDSALFDEGLTLVSRAVDAEYADAETLSGTATMSGVMQAYVGDAEEVILGEMNMVADFDNLEITGSATDLGLYEVSGSFDSNNECEAGASCSAERVQSLGGSLELTGDIDGNSFDGDLAGDITGDYNDEGVSGTFVGDVQMEVDGNFLEDDAGLMAAAELFGSVDLDVTTGDGTFSDTQDLDGMFVVAE